MTFYDIFFHVLSCSFMFFHFLSFSFIFVHFLSSSFIFFHFLSCSFIFFYVLSFSFIFYHFLSFSFMFFHFLSFSFIFFVSVPDHATQPVKLVKRTSSVSKCEPRKAKLQLKHQLCSLLHSTERRKTPQDSSPPQRRKY